MLIRDATRDDVPALVRLMAEDQLGRGREDPGPPLPSGYLAAYEAIAADPHNRLVVLDDEGDVVGTLQLTFIPSLSHGGGWRALVEAVRVAGHRRGQGLGHELMGWAVEQARGRGCRIVQLTSNVARADAHRFYASLGFEPSHTGFKRYLDDAGA